MRLADALVCLLCTLFEYYKNTLYRRNSSFYRFSLFKFKHIMFYCDLYRKYWKQFWLFVGLYTIKPPSQYRRPHYDPTATEVVASLDVFLWKVSFATSHYDLVTLLPRLSTLPLWSARFHYDPTAHSIMRSLRPIRSCPADITTSKISPRSYRAVTTFPLRPRRPV